MKGRIVDDRGVSLLVEYLILMGILSIFVVVMSLQIHDTLSEVQLSRVVENNFADVASQISAIYTDYILILPDSGFISTDIEMPSTIGSLGYSAKLDKIYELAYITIEGGKYSAVSGLGLAKFISNSGGRVINIGVGGETLSFKSEAEKKKDKPKAEYKKSLECPFIPKPRIDFNPSSVALNQNFILKVSFVNKDEINKNIRWNLTLWNGSVISGSEIEKSILLRLNNENEIKTRCVKINNTPNDYECNATIKVEIAELPHCNATDANKLTVSLKPEESNPYLVCKKWVEPRIVSPGDEFDVNLRIEGRGFLLNSTNLSVVHVIDVSGSMIWPTIFWNDSMNVVPHVINKTINLNRSGRLEIYVYTTDRLPQWYSNALCRCTGTQCPWWNKSYDSSFIRLYLNGNEVGSAYSSGQAIGRNYTNNNAQPGTYKIEVVASAPEKINLTLVIRFNNSQILNETFEYLNREIVSFELPPGVAYTFLAITGIQNIPNWDMSYWLFSPQWSDYSRIESYTVSGDSRYWEYRWRLCGDRSYSFQQGSLNAWIILPNGSKQFLLKGENTYWFQARNNYGTNGINADVFIPNPQTGKYEFVVVPTTKNPVTFTATALIKRIDAAKLAAITFNNMLGERDFVGLTNFSTDAQRIVVNSTSQVLKFMTNNKTVVNNEILKLRAELATDHSDGLYLGSRVFPIWNEAGNNCTNCIAGTRPLIILLTDGEPTICNQGANYYNCTLCTQYCSGSSWCEVAKNQALCIADHLKKNVKVNDFNISICTIGFSTDIGGQGQQFLRQMASIPSGRTEPCYFFAETSEELVNAYKNISNIFRTAATNVSVVETLNISVSSPFKLISVSATSSEGRIPCEVVNTENNTIIRLNKTSIYKDEVINLVLRLKVKEDAPYGEYEINDNKKSFIRYTALNYLGEPLENRTINIEECGFVQSKVSIVSGEEARIILR